MGGRSLPQWQRAASAHCERERALIAERQRFFFVYFRCGGGQIAHVFRVPVCVWATDHSEESQSSLAHAAPGLSLPSSLILFPSEASDKVSVHNGIQGRARSSGPRVQRCARMFAGRNTTVQVGLYQRSCMFNVCFFIQSGSNSKMHFEMAAAVQFGAAACVGGGSEKTELGSLSHRSLYVLTLTWLTFRYLRWPSGESCVCLSNPTFDRAQVAAASLRAPLSIFIFP